ncbi:MAG: thiol:disulfide interchange protein, partial [Gemmatimonadetes bacterium]|nr:thiol:disulfide interchange protein [Gemmatimonadota bacterium]NIQ57415.1 thiol:disulfide interchange protein [Gemmatimonadota bacterium]NIU77581.1 thiol:disulfide interchange protein [Gammaproteobacteria bacterium]NIX46763.1 thiol:disulfide interchange protein [Gemmatimonadota bacterium]NIY11117.1 thiol:disulfide interchange protein [Gemmatimonadota bacterium]
AVRPGEPFTVGLHITLDDGWHTYWKNAGDAGNGVFMDWELPDGFAVDSLRYPVPKRIPYPPLMNYGYEDEVVMLATVTPPADAGAGPVTLAAEADFLVCADVCIPAHTRVSLDLPVRDGEPARSDAAPLIDRFRDRLPVESGDWELRAARTGSGFVLAARPPEGWDGALGGAYFFPESPVVLSHTAEQPAGTAADGELRLRLTPSEYLEEEPEELRGILALPEGAAFDAAGHRGLEVVVPVQRGDVAWTAESVTPLTAPQTPAGAGSGAGGAGLSLLVALLFAFVGGLILNLMPCVFPILSLKALGFASRGGDRAGMRRDGLAFGAGVVLTFLLVAGVLIAVRAGGAEVGWGYQLQSPTIVALLAALMFGIGLWLAGVVELGASLTRLGGFGDGDRSSFLTGVLATVVATPCTAPFMGAAIGAALVRPAVEALAIFAGLGLGMAAPYVLLSFWPALARRLPRPGRWMETFKQVLAFPMFAVAVWLVWVFGLQVGVGGAARLLFGLLLLAVAAWLVGRWPATTASARVRLTTRSLAALAVVLAVLATGAAIRAAEPPPMGAEASGTALEWETFSEEAVAAHRQAGRPVFVDFTAAWCISCQVNERVALDTRAVREAFRRHDVALLKADWDWTRRDPAITRALESFGRVGVPLYVLYPADPAAEPRILPELLTQTLVLDALREVAAGTPDRKQARSED